MLPWGFRIRICYRINILSQRVQEPIYLHRNSCSQNILPTWTPQWRWDKGHRLIGLLSPEILCDCTKANACTISVSGWWLKWHQMMLVQKPAQSWQRQWLLEQSPSPPSIWCELQPQLQLGCMQPLLSEDISHAMKALLHVQPLKRDPNSVPLKTALVVLCPKAFWAP